MNTSETTHSAPIGIYIHWPFCRAKCPYCDFNSHVRAEVDVAAWQAALLAELEWMAGHMPGTMVESIFFGGGTPSLMPPAITGALIDRVQALFPVVNDLEVTLEANPTSSEAQKFRDFQAAGVNRLSIGVQSLDAEALRFLGREHDVAEALAAVALARSTFDRCSFDLIYARPGQTLVQWEAELAAALAHAPDHLSLYQLTVEPETPFSRWHAVGGFVLPPEEDAAEVYDATLTRCADAGLEAYEISNFARPGAECRHNLGYWEGRPYLGIGPGAHGRMRTAEGWIASATLKSPERWLAAAQRDGRGIETWEPLDAAARGEEIVLTRLRLVSGINKAKFADLVGLPLETVISVEKIAFYVEKGLLKDSPTHLTATTKGRRVLNRLLEALLV